MGIEEKTRSGEAAPGMPAEQVKARARVDGRTLKSWPRDLYIPPDALEVFLERFQGPLDLLLYLIRRQNIEILDIPVARITRQYMEYVELMRQFKLDLAAEYLVMAAMLAEIKSRMLLPRPVILEDEEEEDPRAELVRRLREYERFNQAGRDLDAVPRVERDLYLVSASIADQSVVEVQDHASMDDLASAFRNVVERSELHRSFSIDREELNVREKMTGILDRIRTARPLRFEELFDEREGRAGIVVNFMAVLELVRDNLVTVFQNEPFAPIHIGQSDRSRPGAPASAPEEA